MTDRDDAQLCADDDDFVEEPTTGSAADPLVEIVPQRGTCQTHLRGWAGGHLHGAVRPRRRAAGRGRPPGRWC